MLIGFSKVSTARFERAAYRLGSGCSIQLSYADKVYKSLVEFFKSSHRKAQWPLLPV